MYSDLALSNLHGRIQTARLLPVTPKQVCVCAGHGGRGGCDAAAAASRLQSGKHDVLVHDHWFSCNSDTVSDVPGTRPVIARMLHR